MKLEGRLEHDEVEALVKAEIVRRFPQFRLDYLIVPYVSGTRFTLDDEPVPAKDTEEAA